VPPAERAERQAQLDAFREMLGGIFGGQLAGSCAENVRIEIQRDRYGCYGADAAAAGQRTPCSLISAGELTKLLGRPFAAGQAANSACEYDTPAPGRAVRIEVEWTDGRSDVQAWRDGAGVVGQEVRQKQGQEALVGIEPVTVVGADEAFIVAAGFTPFLVARKGAVAITVRANGATKQQISDVARLVLSRIK
jgi:hypothetical protein